MFRLCKSALLPAARSRYDCFGKPKAFNLMEINLTWWPWTEKRAAEARTLQGFAFQVCLQETEAPMEGNWHLSTRLNWKSTDNRWWFQTYALQAGGSEIKQHNLMTIKYLQGHQKPGVRKWWCTIQQQFSQNLDSARGKMVSLNMGQKTIHRVEERCVIYQLSRAKFPGSLQWNSHQTSRDSSMQDNKQVGNYKEFLLFGSILTFATGERLNSEKLR